MIAPVGQFCASWAPYSSAETETGMYDKLFSTFISGLILVHFIQPMHATAQFLRATAPFWVLRQATYTRLPFLPLGRISNNCRGHILTQAPQDVHLSSSTTGIPVSGSMCKASNLHTLTQSPKRRQPEGHPVWPLDMREAIRQLLTPS